MEVYVEPFFPSPHLYIVGSSPMAQVLASLATNLGWRVNITDDDDLSGAVAGSLVVVATQGHHDEPALEAALATEAAYIGLVASAKRASTVMEYLRQRGHDEVAVARIEAPAGLDLGGTSHEETAVAILAGLVANRNRTSKVATIIPAEAIDPICGMTVDPATARFRTEHDGKTYWFCAAGCQAAFEASHR
jgi:xanthine dehydrogenase accessory factor